MAPNKVKSDSASGGRKLKRYSIEMKKEIIEKHERGVRVSDLASQYRVAKSTICTFLKHKETLKAADVAKGVFGKSNKRPQILEKVEQLLLVWINEKQLQGDSVSEAIIREKARHLHRDLIGSTPSSHNADKPEDFKASRGWFQKFRKRSGIHCVLRHGETSEDEPPLPDEDVDLKLEIKEEVVDDTPTEFVNVLDHVEELPASKEEHDVDTLAVSKPFISASSSNVQFLDLNPHQMETPPVQKENPVDILAVTKPSIISSTCSALPSKVEDGDEFHFFGMFVASQLRALPLRDALQAQLEIQTIIAQKRSQRLT